MWIHQDPVIIDLLDKHSIPDMLKQIQKTAMKDETHRHLGRQASNVITYLTQLLLV
jgi:hypothetical protein